MSKKTEESVFRGFLFQILGKYQGYFPSASNTMLHPRPGLLCEEHSVTEVCQTLIVVMIEAQGIYETQILLKF